MLRGQRQWQPGQPPGEEGLHVRGAQAVANALQRGGIGTGRDPIVERREWDAAPPELALGPLVAVEAQLERVGRVAAHLEEGRPPVGVDHVDVVVVHIDRLPPEGEMHVAPLLGLGRRPARGAFLRHAHQHDPRGRGEAVPVLLDDVILALPLGELDPRNPSRRAPGPHPLLEGVGDLPKDRRRGHHPAPGLTKKGDHPTLALQPGNVPVDVQPIHALHFQRHVVSDNLRCVGHDVLPRWATKEISPNSVREKRHRSLGRPAVTRRFEAQLR